MGLHWGLSTLVLGHWLRDGKTCVGVWGKSTVSMGSHRLTGGLMGRGVTFGTLIEGSKEARRRGESLMASTTCRKQSTANSRLVKRLLFRADRKQWPLTWFSIANLNGTRIVLLGNILMLISWAIYRANWSICCVVSGGYYRDKYG